MSVPTYQGSCLCEGVKFTVSGTAEKVFVCHCTDCSKNAGGPYQVIAKYPKSAVEVTSGSDLLGNFVITKTSSGSEKHKIFCKQCGCTLWTIPMHTGGNNYIVRTPLLDNGLDLEPFKPVAEFFSSLRPKWLPALEGTQCFDTMPGK